MVKVETENVGQVEVEVEALEVRLDGPQVTDST